MSLKGLIPNYFGHYDYKSILRAASVYENDFPVSMMLCLKAEIFIWKNSGNQKQIFQSLLLKHLNIVRISCQTL